MEIHTVTAQKVQRKKHNVKRMGEHEDTTKTYVEDSKIEDEVDHHYISFRLNRAFGRRFVVAHLLLVRFMCGLLHSVLNHSWYNLG